MKKTIDLKVPYKDIHEVRQALKESNIKHWPFKRAWPGYVVTVEDGPAASFMILKFAR